jgi:hypothetical protein
MADKPHDRTRAMMRAGKESAGEPVVVPDPERTDERGMRRQTLYLPPGVYEHIRDTCYTARKSQQALFREIFDFYFKRHGGKSWDQLEKENPPKKKAKPKQ